MRIQRNNELPYQKIIREGYDKQNVRKADTFGPQYCLKIVRINVKGAFVAVTSGRHLGLRNKGQNKNCTPKIVIFVYHISYVSVE